MTPPGQLIWIDKPDQLDCLVKNLLNERWVAVDTESDSLYSYFEKVCLVQFSTSRADYLVDPLKADISSLASFFADESIQKIFHAAEYDLISLKRDYNFRFNNLFDTMLAARILGWSHYGLGALLDQWFNIKLNKRFQRYNWGERPLSQEALAYARLDTHYLLPLREIQLNQLKQHNRLQEAMEAFERETHVEPTPKIFNPDDFWRIKGSKDLEPQQQAVLRELFVLRDKIARRINRPPFKIINNSVLLQLAKEQPQNDEDLRHTKGIGGKLLQHNAHDILKSIQVGQTVPPPHHLRHTHRPDEEIINRYETLRQWRNNLAVERGVEPDVIINNNALMDIARHNPKTLANLTKIGVLGDWQCKTYGRTLLKVLKGTAHSYHQN